MRISDVRATFRDQCGLWEPGLRWASEEWFGVLAEIFVEESLLAPDHLRSASFSLQEVLRDVPPDGHTVAWHVRVRDGEVTGLGYGTPVPDIDTEILVSYPAVLPVARLMRADPEYAASISRLRAAGSSTVVLHAGERPFAQYREMFARVHDRMALRTR